MSLRVHINSKLYVYKKMHTVVALNAHMNKLNGWKVPISFKMALDTNSINWYSLSQQCQSLFLHFFRYLPISVHDIVVIQEEFDIWIQSATLPEHISHDVLVSSPCLIEVTMPLLIVYIPVGQSVKHFMM